VIIKFKRLFKILTLLIAALMCSLPFATLAQQNSLQAEAIAAAERDAQNNVNKSLWVMRGCCILGPDAARRSEPSLPAARLLGKSPEYVAFYAAAYRAKAKSLQIKSARAGFFITTLGLASLYSCLAYVILTENR
jgi:hypothetical protein